MTTEIKQRIYKMIFYGHVTDAEKILSENPTLSPCLLALVYAVQNKTRHVKEILEANGRNYPDAIDQLACEEANMILISVKTGPSSALDLAAKIVEKHHNAAIANYFIAQNALKQHKWDIAFEHYQNIIEIYPDNDGLLLDVAEVLVFQKKSSIALKYVESAKVSLRQRLYKILILSLGKPLSRVMTLLVISGLFVITGLNAYVYIGFLAMMSVGFLASFKRDLLVSSSIIYLTAFGTIIWLLFHWM